MKKRTLVSVVAVVLIAAAGLVMKAKATSDCDTYHFMISSAPSQGHTEQVQNSDGTWSQLASYPTMTPVSAGQSFKSTLSSQSYPNGNPGPGTITTINYSSYYDACSDGTRHWQNGSFGITGVPAGAKSVQWHWQQSTPPNGPVLVVDHISY